MPKLEELKKELHELRENTLNEYKEFEAVDFDSEKKEEWAKRNEKMAELVTQVKEATKIESERKAMEDELEAGKQYDRIARKHNQNLFLLNFPLQVLPHTIRKNLFYDMRKR